MLNRILFKGFVGATIGASFGFFATNIDKKSDPETIDYERTNQCSLKSSLYLATLHQQQNAYWAPQQDSSLWNFAIPFVTMGGFVFGIIYGAYDELIRKQINLDAYLTLQIAAKEANTIYKSESRLPFAKSNLAGEFGLFSFSRHESNAGDMFEEKLLACENIEKARQFIISILNKNGSLWDCTKGFNHSFTNYFLTCLRHENIRAYREIVGQAYGIKFVSKNIRLYRRDARKREIIFKEGFQLKDSSNSYSTRKGCYADPITYSFGISFSKKIPPSHYGDQSEYYVVNLSAQHNFLLVDIVESPRNRERLTAYNINLQEVNSLDNIPCEAVEMCVTTESQRIGIFQSSRKRSNPKFTKDVVMDDTKKKNMGCY